jgi:hypothetical protein
MGLTWDLRQYVRLQYKSVGLCFFYEVGSLSKRSALHPCPAVARRPEIINTTGRIIAQPPASDDGGEMTHGHLDHDGTPAGRHLVAMTMGLPILDTSLSPLDRLAVRMEGRAPHHELTATGSKDGLRALDRRAT